MARDLKLLEDDFEETVRKLLKRCEGLGYPMRPFFTLRSVYDQAKLYRQSRSYHEIVEAHKMLKDNGAKYLAGVLMDVGPQSGQWATNALPGVSWHQHGKAVDCYWLLNGKAEWSTKVTAPPNLGNVDTAFMKQSENGYSVYAREAQNLGLVAGHFWRNKDSVHVQKNNSSISRLIRNGKLTWKELDAKMKEMHQ